MSVVFRMYFLLKLLTVVCGNHPIHIQPHLISPPHTHTNKRLCLIIMFLHCPLVVTVGKYFYYYYYYFEGCNRKYCYAIVSALTLM